MLTQILQQSRRVILTEFRRNFGVTAVVCQKATDPIQALFLDKIREYAEKSKAAGGKLVEATPAIERDLQAELDKLNHQFGVTGPDFLNFPTFEFTDQSLEMVGTDAKILDLSEEAAGVAAVTGPRELDLEEANRAHWEV